MLRIHGTLVIQQRGLRVTAYLLFRTGFVGGVLTAALLGPASMLGLPEPACAASADCCMRCRVASAASPAFAAAMRAASSNLSPALHL